MNEYGVVAGADTVRFERVLPGPIERVWAYLTESEKRGKWMATGAMELKSGGRVELKFNHAELSSKTEPVPERYKKQSGVHVMQGKITRCDPPRLLSFTWGDGGNGREDSEVTFELSPRGNDVLLILTHRRLADRAAMVDVSGGWHLHLALLEDRLNNRRLRPFWSSLAEYEAEYQKRIPAK